MMVAIVSSRTIEFEDWDRLDERTVDQRLLHKGESVPLESAEGLGKPFVAFVRKGGTRAAASSWHLNVMIPRIFSGEPDQWLCGPVIVAAYSEDGGLRGLTEQEQQQVQIWGGGPNYSCPLLMIADPE